MSVVLSMFSTVRRLTAVGVCALSVAGGALAAPATASAPEGDYIVVLKDSVAHPSDVAAEHRRRHGARVTFTYGTALKGYAARLSAEGYAEVVRDPRVAYVERDGVASTSTTQSNATWGLDRIDQTSLPLSTTFSYANTGTGVTAYIIDTGIDLGHGEFGGRATEGYDVFNEDAVDDCNGHGTHVAGTVGGTTYGVAKAVRLVSVRVLDCGGSGSWSGVIAGVDWVTENHVKPAVANMSLGGGASTSVDTAVKNSIAAGVSYAIAAGNGNQGGVAQDACKYSPARVADAMTISATGKTDGKTSWGNYGSCVDWFAPGAGITAAWIGSGATETNTISGTSMATPHTAGVAALYLQSNPSAAPTTVRTTLYNATTKGVVTSSKTANNHLLFTSY